MRLRGGQACLGAEGPSQMSGGNADQTWPMRVIRRGEVVRPLPPHDRSLADLTFEVGGVRLDCLDPAQFRYRIESHEIAI